MAMLPVSFNAEMFVDASQVSLPDNVRQGFGDMMSAAFAGMSAGGFRRIVIGKTGFQLVDGGGTVEPGAKYSSVWPPRRTGTNGTARARRTSGGTPRPPSAACGRSAPPAKAFR